MVFAYMAMFGVLSYIAAAAFGASMEAAEDKRRGESRALLVVWLMLTVATWVIASIGAST